jgi:hypothetical protein
MKQTTTWQIPYPESPDHTRTWEYWQAIADRVDTCLTTLKNGVPVVQAGTVNMSINNATSGSATVTFPRTFTAVPTLAVNINSGAGIGGAGGCWSKMFNITTSGGTLFLNAASPVTFSNVPVQWTAFMPPATPLAAALQATDAPAGWHYVTATCRTPGCPSENQPVENILVPDVPEDWGWSGITCGACGQEITDIVPA